MHWMKVIKQKAHNMATELRAIKGTDITQTRFAGGVERGTWTNYNLL